MSDPTDKPLPKLRDRADDDVVKPVVNPDDDPVLKGSLGTLMAANKGSGDALYRPVQLVEETPDVQLPNAASAYIGPTKIPVGADPTLEKPRVVVSAQHQPPPPPAPPAPPAPRAPPAPPAPQAEVVEEPVRALPPGIVSKSTEKTLPRPPIVPLFSPSESGLDDTGHPLISDAPVRPPRLSKAAIVIGAALTLFIVVILAMRSRLTGSDVVNHPIEASAAPLASIPSILATSAPPPPVASSAPSEAPIETAPPVETVAPKPPTKPTTNRPTTPAPTSSFNLPPYFIHH